MQMGRDLTADVVTRRQVTTPRVRRWRTRVVMRLGLIMAMLATSFVLADAAAAQGDDQLDVEVSCLAGNGRLDIAFVATSTATHTIHVGTLAPRTHVASVGETITEVVTGRPDGALGVDVRIGGVIVAETTVRVDCDPPEQTRVETSCLDGNGRIDVWAVGPPNGPAPTELEVLFVRDSGQTIGPRTIILFNEEVERVTTTGRPDDDYTVIYRTAGRFGVDIVPELRVTLFEERVSVRCDAPTDPVTLTESCLAENGRLDFDLFNSGSAEATFVVTVPPIPDRSRTLAPGASARVSYTGRPDKPIAASVTRDGSQIWQQTVTPACDPTIPTPTPEPADDSLGALPSGVTPVIAGETWVTVGLREAASVAQVDGEQIATVAGTPLDDGTTAALLDRLPELIADAGDQVEFRPPEVSLPRPSSFDTIPDEFPPPSSPGPVEVPDGPLDVLRFQPDGETTVAPFLAVTFNQPMVALGAIGEIEAAASPVQLDPPVPGRWIWIGTRTLRFEYDGEFDRLPGATTYTATIPAGTTSATGSALGEPFSWTFQTAPASLESIYPRDGATIDLDQVFVARFDQLIDPAAVIDATSLRVAGFAKPVRQASPQEIAADDRIASIVDASQPGKFVALRAVEDFPKDTPIRVEFAGLPSAEGPLRQAERLGASYRTYGPFEITGTTCGYRNRCQAFDSLTVNLSNQIDGSLFDSDAVTISPEIPGARVTRGYRRISILGLTSARTTYTVTVPADLTDTFGQQITGPRTVTFEVGDATPSLSLFGGRPSFVTLDPFLDEPVIDYSVVNIDSVRIQATAVTAEAWADWIRRFNGALPPGEVVFDEQVLTGAPPNEPTILTNDLGGALVDHDFVIVRVQGGEYEHFAWVQATQLGVDVTSDQDELRVWVTDLRTGDPVRNATVTDTDRSIQVTTNVDGAATIALDRTVGPLVVSLGDDTAIAPRTNFGSSWSPRPQRDQLRWHTFDDRNLYRPGETVSVKGWIRRYTAATDAQLAPSGVSAIAWTAFDPVGNELASGRADVSTLGGFDLSFTTPTNANLGRARVQLSAFDGEGVFDSATHTFQLQEFRRPEFEVTVDVRSPAPHFAGETAVVEATAAYFSGGALSDSDVAWRVTSTPTSYRPAGWDAFSFGAYAYGGSTAVYEGTTDANGVHPLELDFATEPDSVPRPVSVMAAATVTDVNLQQFDDATTLLVHPADRYVGLRTERGYVRVGDSLDVDAIVTDLDGNAVPGVAVTLEAVRLVGRWNDGWTSEEVDAQTCSVTSAAGPVGCAFAIETGGRWSVRATIRDADGRPNFTEIGRWAAGGRLGQIDRVARESLELIADRDQYQPGDSAQVLVVAPFATGHARVTTARNGILAQQTVEVVEGAAELTIEIDETMAPNLWLHVEAVGATPRFDGQDLLRPAYAGATVLLNVPPLSKILDVEVTPADTAITPGSSTSATVRVTDAAGLPVGGAEVALVAVDEAVLALVDYSVPDPMAAFWKQVSSSTSTTNGRNSVVLASLPFDGPVEDDDFVLDGVESPVADAGAGFGEAADRGVSSDVAARTNFDPLAVFAPEVLTSADGSATVTFDVPDNLTRYRLVAVAVSDADRFGSGESSFTARLPLMVRPSAPRFANFGDAFELPVVIQNQTDAAIDVDVALRATNLAVTGPAGQRVQVPANNRVEVRFSTAADEAGTARFQVIAASGANADAAEIDLPVFTPATSESFATYGVLDGGATAQPIVAPDDVFSQFGGLEIGTSTTALHSLSDAVLHLAENRYASADALASRIIAIAALDDVLAAFGAEDLPSPEVLRSVVARDIDDLLSLQNSDGGFSTWRRGTESWPWASLHGAHALTVASANGYEVPSGPLARALGYAASIEEHIPERYAPQTQDALNAYALHIRDLSGDRDVAKATRFFRADLHPEALGWIWPVVDQATAAEIGRLLNNTVVETPSSATFATDAQDGDWLILRSSRRTDAIVLDAMIRVDASNDLIPKVAAGLQAQRSRGRWSSLGENTFALLAFERYFSTFEAIDPDLIARIWLGDLYAAEHAHPERSTDRIQTVVPMAEVLEAGDTEIVVQDDGVGRLYWRLGLRYAPTDLELDPLDRGFVVQRTYSSLGDPEDVTQDADGTWRITAGADVLVRVSMVADSVRSHVALIDPLPAGLEPLNPRVSNSVPEPFFDGGIGFPGDIADSPAFGFVSCRFCWSWFNHQNLRDDRAEAFSTYLYPGTYDYTYVTRATTIGRFVTPPARAEMIHEPEVFGRSESNIVVIE